MSDDRSGQPTLADVGEDGLLAAIFPRLPHAAGTLVGPGDDTAVVNAPDGRVVATTDVLVEGRDFRRDWSSAQDVGWKAAAQNLADVAAMGAVPTALLVGLVAPPELEVSWAVGLADGLAAACSGTGAGVVGGDLSSGPLIVVSVTALGDLQGRDPVLRSQARPGEVVAVAGPLGRSAAGWELLRLGRGDVAAELVAAHRRPTPPYASGVVAAVAGATSMLDVSDGLGRDLGRIARASGVGINLDGWLADASAFPELLAAAQVLSDPSLVLSWVLGGGEDHCLVATFPADATLPDGFDRIGEVIPATGPAPVLLDGEPLDTLGWDHFRP
ncbi:thiamine-phosphate kinase [Angustibacter sp. McL0619]|uniref:thiamine-phosphate kinase n=1 Tax=Angustibacter sp. McL0619 TaxID=3415676 RepID=UPI003CF7D1AF